MTPLCKFFMFSEIECYKTFYNVLEREPNFEKNGESHAQMMSIFKTSFLKF